MRRADSDVPTATESLIMYAHEKIIIKHQQDAFPLTFSPGW